MTEKYLLNEYLLKKIDGLDIEGSIDLNWDKVNRAFEIEFLIMGNNQHELPIEKQDGTESNEEQVSFFDSILIYDETKLKGSEYTEDYLKVVPFSGKKGIKKSLIDALFSYLQDVLDDGESDLIDFLNDPSIEMFELKWNDKRFDEIVNRESAKENLIYLSYPRY